jgi:hypothetical protein
VREEKKDKEQGEAKKAWRVKAMCTAKTTRFNETVDTRSGGVRERFERGEPSMCTARPYFNREIRTKRGKEGCTRLGEERGWGGEEEQCARKKLESRKSKNTAGRQV